MTRNVADKRAAFRALHAAGCFVLPNPWDVGSGRVLERLGFLALASTSSGFAWSTGRPDYGVRCEDVLAHLTKLCDAVDIPVNADFESGFARDAEGVAANVTRAIDTGVSGLSIEDKTFENDDALYDLPTSLERLRAARQAIDRSGHDVLLVARTEGLLLDASAVAPAIDKLVAFADAGADCLYAPGLTTKEDIVAVVRAVAPKPVNVVMSSPRFTVAELTDLGVRRISVGGALSRVAWAAMFNAAEQLKAGSFEGLADAMPGSRLNQTFERRG